MRFDLHAHSTASDGKLSPEELVDLLKPKNLDLFALTDHDTINGYLKLRQSNRLGCVKHWVSGVEFSCLAGKQNVHIVALDFDHEHPAIVTLLAQQAKRREARAVEIASKLQKLGLPDLYADALAIAGSKDSIGRPHFAQALVAEGHCRTEQQAFDRWLGSGKKGDVKLFWPSMQEVLSVIKQSGGVSVLAHPLRYKLTFTKIRELIAQFAEAGGDAVEVVGQQAKPDQLKHLVKVVASHKLAASGGSDFHNPNWAWAPLGEVASLPEGLPPVWQLFKHTVIEDN